MFIFRNKLMEEAGGEGGTGGGGAGGEGGTQITQENWRDFLNDDLKEDKSLADFSDINSLAKSYVNARSMIGADTIAIPKGEEGWDEVYNKLGRPEDVDGYELKIPENIDAKNPIIQGFRGVVHKAGLNQSQTDMINSWYWETMAGVAQDNDQAAEDAYEASTAALQKTWGEKLEANLALANRTIDTVGGEEFAQYLESKGLYNDPQMVQFLYNVAQMSAEDSELRRGEGSPNGSTPGELQDKINELMATPAYTDKSSPEHKSTVDKVQKLFGRLHGA